MTPEQIKDAVREVLHEELSEQLKKHAQDADVAVPYAPQGVGGPVGRPRVFSAVWGLLAAFFALLPRAAVGTGKALRHLKTPCMLFCTFVLPPLAIAASWMLWPLWFVPLHEWGWGPVDVTEMALGVGMLHGLGGGLPVVLMWMMTLLSRFEPGGECWWWEKK